MNTEEQVLELCAKAAASQDPDEVTEILSALRAVLREHTAEIRRMIEERRRWLLDHGV